MMLEKFAYNLIAGDYDSASSMFNEYGRDLIFRLSLVLKCRLANIDEHTGDAMKIIMAINEGRHSYAQRQVNRSPGPLFDYLQEYLAEIAAKVVNGVGLERIVEECPEIVSMCASYHLQSDTPVDRRWILDTIRSSGA